MTAWGQLGELCVWHNVSRWLEQLHWQNGSWKRDSTETEACGEIEEGSAERSSTSSGENIPGLVDDQRSEKDRPPQSGGCNFLSKKSLSKNHRTAFAQALLFRNIPASQVCPFPRRHDKKATLYQSSFSMFLIQLSSFNPAGLQAACANVHSPCTTVDFTFNASDVGIPDTVGSSMGMAYVVTEMSAFATNIAFCHDCTSSNYIRRLTDNISMITELNTFGK